MNLTSHLSLLYFLNTSICELSPPKFAEISLTTSASVFSFVLKLNSKYVSNDAYCNCLTLKSVISNNSLEYEIPLVIVLKCEYLILFIVSKLVLLNGFFNSTSRASTLLIFSKSSFLSVLACHS